VDIIRYRTAESPAPLVGVRDEGQVFALPGMASLADLWALPLAEIRQRVVDRGAVPAAPAADVTPLPPIDGRTEVWVGYLMRADVHPDGVVRGLDRVREAFGRPAQSPGDGAQRRP
jgi:hypothetical protein